MTSDRREDKKLTRDEVRKILNHKQLEALLECQHFGWRLKFIRSPLYQEPIPVIYNAEIARIGVLDLDGYINMDLELEVRSSNPKIKTDQFEQAEKTPEAAPREERRKDIAPIPENLDEFLNLQQKHALHQIESFGWKLHFVRRPLFQDPIPVILSPNGKEYATLEMDGRINVNPDSDLRKKAPAEQTESTLSMPALNLKRS